jgi:hypothetical protein
VGKDTAPVARRGLFCPTREEFQMFALIGRFGLLLVAGKVFERVVRHPKVAPIARSRRGRLALLALGWGLRRHRRTRLAGHVMGRAARVARRRV